MLKFAYYIGLLLCFKILEEKMTNEQLALRDAILARFGNIIGEYRLWITCMGNYFSEHSFISKDTLMENLQSGRGIRPIGDIVVFAFEKGADYEYLRGMLVEWLKELGWAKVFPSENTKCFKVVSENGETLYVLKMDKKENEYIPFLLVDSQSDFGKPEDLPVRKINLGPILRIHSALDQSARTVQIFEPHFWKDENGETPKPFTVITVQDVRNGKFFPRDEKFDKEFLIKYLTQLENGK